MAVDRNGGHTMVALLLSVCTIVLTSFWRRPDFYEQAAWNSSLGLNILESKPWEFFRLFCWVKGHLKWSRPSYCPSSNQRNTHRTLFNYKATWFNQTTNKQDQVRPGLFSVSLLSLSLYGGLKCTSNGLVSIFFNLKRSFKQQVQALIGEANRTNRWRATSN